MQRSEIRGPGTQAKLGSSVATYGEASEHVARIRRADIEALHGLFKPGDRVLELGGGNGYQASVIAGWGCVVDSIDIQLPASSELQHYPVQIYDGQSIPFPDATFDIVYSFAVLEHVPNPPALLTEVLRVLKPGGRSVHLMPSATWRFWTLLAHYPYHARRVLSGSSTAASATSEADGQPSHSARRPLWRRVLIDGPHGEYPNALSELYYYRRQRWRGVFEQSGFQVISARGNGFFHTGYRLFPWLSPAARHRVAYLLGSASNIFVTQRFA